VDSYGVQQKGIGLEVERLSSTFQPFGYDILIFRNLRAAQIKSYLSSSGLESFAKKPLKNYASLIVCLLGHGDKGVLFGVDDVPVSLNEIQYEAFNDLSCPDLKGKPKVFIVLACQGEKKQQVIQIPTNDRSTSLSMPIVSAIINNNNEEYQLPPVYDFIRFVSTIEEYESYFCKFYNIYNAIIILNFDYGFYGRLWHWISLHSIPLQRSKKRVQRSHQSREEREEEEGSHSALYRVCDTHCRPFGR